LQFQKVLGAEVGSADVLAEVLSGQSFNNFLTIAIGSGLEVRLEPKGLCGRIQPSNLGLHDLESQRSK